MDPRQWIIFICVVLALIGAIATIVSKVTTRTSSYVTYTEDDVPMMPEKQ